MIFFLLIYLFKTFRIPTSINHITGAFQYVNTIINVAGNAVIAIKENFDPILRNRLTKNVIYF